MEGIGTVRHFVPERWSGADGSWREFAEATFVAARTSGSFGWVFSFLAYPAMLITHFPEEAQKMVWADGPDARIAGTYAPVGSAVRVGGGYRLSGHWLWCSGVAHCRWVVLGALTVEAGKSPEYKLLLLEKSKVEVVDTWDVMGLRGSGSYDIHAKDLFVPDEHVVAIESVREGHPVGEVRHRAPFVFTVPLSLAAPVVGTAIAALSSFREVAGQRPLAKEDGVLARQTYVEVVNAVDSAREAILTTASRADAGGPFTPLERARARLAYAGAVRSSVQAMDALVTIAGPRMNYNDSSLQRSWRDVLAMSQHRLLDYPRAADLLARVELGMEIGKTDWLY